MAEAGVIHIRPVDLLDVDQDRDARAWIAVHETARRHSMGEDGSARTLAEVRDLHRTGHKLYAVRGAWLGGELVGALELAMPVLDNQRLATVWLSVAPAARRHGVGAALYAEVEPIARQHGRMILQTQTFWAPGGADDGEAFARRHGFDIGMTDLRNSMRLADHLVALGAMASAARARHDDYDVESAVDELPEAWLEDRAVLKRRMMTDMPLGGLTLEEEQWDAERLRGEVARLRGSGHRLIETIARHRPTGRIVGFTQITVGPERPWLGQQEDTLVLREHRGHGLGLRLKAANAVLLAELMPEVTTIRTWNADDNAPMLEVNRVLGFRVDGYARNWQKRLT